MEAETRNRAPAPEARDGLEALADRLIANLGVQRSLYGEYAELAERQRYALVRRDIPANQEINAAAELAADRLQALERERLALTWGLLRAAGAPAGDAERATCADLMPWLDPERAERLASARAALRADLDRLRRALKANEALIANARRLIHATFAIITTAGADEGPAKHARSLYGRDGSLPKDRPQVRRLINRTV